MKHIRKVPHHKEQWEYNESAESLSDIQHESNTLDNQLATMKQLVPEQEREAFMSECGIVDQHKEDELTQAARSFSFS